MGNLGLSAALLVGVMQIAGIIVVAGGIAMIYVPAGVIFLGIALTTLGVALERGTNPKDT